MWARFLSKFVPVNVFEKLIAYHSSDVSSFKGVFLSTHPGFLEEMGKKKVVHAFKRVASEVPCYKRFLKKHKIDVSSVNNYKDFLNLVPEVNKQNYVKKAKKISDLCVNGSVADSGMLVRSSGYSGKSSTWAKSRKEQHGSRNFATLGLDLLYNTTKKKTLLIDSFALGSWVSGIDLLLVANAECTVVAPGADIDETLSIFNDLNKEYNQFIIAGTPHFIKYLAEEAIKKKINFKKHKVHFLIGGEYFTEEWRNYVNNLVGTTTKIDNNGHIFSGYGASELGITGVNETKESSYLRHLCLKNKKLRRALFGKFENVLPILFQYDPTKYHIIVNKKDELVFTMCDSHALMPLVKYNIKDIGGLISHDEMQQILEENGVKLDLKIPLPFVFVVGRTGGTVNFIGSPIYPNYIYDAMIGHKEIKSKFTGAFRLKAITDKKYNPILRIEIQLKKGFKVSRLMIGKLEKLFYTYFVNLDNDFRTNFELLKKETSRNPIKVYLYEHDEYPHKHTIKVRHV